MDSPKDLYRQSGPNRVSLIDTPGPGTITVIPENRNRLTLAIFSGNIAMRFWLVSLNRTNVVGVALAANGSFFMNTDQHGTILQEAWNTEGLGAGTYWWTETTFYQPDDHVIEDDPADKLREQMLKRKRKREELRQRIEAIPNCQAQLLLTPLQHMLKMQGLSGIGGGGGESGSDSLGSSSPLLIGD